MSRFFGWLMGSKWTHVGMIIIDSKYDFPLVYESCHSTRIKGLDIGRTTVGVQIIPFYERLEKYPGDMVLRRLEDARLTEDAKYRLRLFRRAMVGKPFERNFWQIIGANYRWFFLPKEENLSSVFCSELIAQCYIELGLLPTTLPSNKYCPADFSEERVMDLRQGYLGDEEIIKLHKKPA